MASQSTSGPSGAPHPSVPPPSYSSLATQHMISDEKAPVPQNRDEDLPEVVPQISPDHANTILDAHGRQTAIEPLEDNTVTPLNLLKDQADFIDCPFCRRRTETVVKKHPSAWTHASATALLLSTVVGAVEPYRRQWRSHISHHCKNCGRKVAYLARGKEVEVFGTPEHLREPSRFAGDSQRAGNSSA